MISEKYLYEWEETIPTRIRVPGVYTLQHLKQFLEDPKEGLPTIGIPVVYETDQIKSGGVFNKQLTDCLIIRNQQHMYDYFCFVLIARNVGNFTGIEIWRYGTSALSYKQNKKEERKSSSSLFQNIVGGLTKTDSQGLEAEYMYYDLVADVLKKIFGI